VTLAHVWRTVVDRDPPPDPGGEWTAHLQTILDQGTLASRMIKEVGSASEREAIRRLMGRLCQCLDDNEALAPS